MFYRHVPQGHILELSSEETNQFFDPYDGHDYKVPSYLVLAGHRFIKEHIYDWLLANVGEPKISWEHAGSNVYREFIFTSKEDALLFKLAWG